MQAYWGVKCKKCETFVPIMTHTEYRWIVLQPSKMKCFCGHEDTYVGNDAISENLAQPLTKEILAMCARRFRITDQPTATVKQAPS
jgi:hypothetical protein